jgi:hypothetical protein
MGRLFSCLLGALGAAAIALPASAQAPSGPPPAPARVAGQIQTLDGNTLTVAQASGPATILLADNWTVTVLKKIDVGAIKPGSFIGTTNVDKPDGTGQSTEVHVFPPGVRGGEGHYPMPGQNAMMTNGDVTTVVTGAKGQEVDIKYNGRGGSGVRHVVVPPGTPIVQFTPGDRSVIKPGVNVLIFAIKGQDGALHANGVITGENGAAPPL